MTRLTKEFGFSLWQTNNLISSLCHHALHTSSVPESTATSPRHFLSRSVVWIANCPVTQKKLVNAIYNLLKMNLWPSLATNNIVHFSEQLLLKQSMLNQEQFMESWLLFNLFFHMLPSTQSLNSWPCRNAWNRQSSAKCCWNWSTNTLSLLLSALITNNKQTKKQAKIKTQQIKKQATRQKQTGLKNLDISSGYR